MLMIMSPKKQQRGPMCGAGSFVCPEQTSQMPSRDWTEQNCLGHKHSFPCEPLHFTPSELWSVGRLASA